MKRSKHSLSFYKLATMDMGELVPVGVYEVLPGDTVQQATSAFIRVSPLLTPVMHPVHIKIHHWYVPYRLVWDDWEAFITGGEDGLDASTFPTISVGGGVSQGSLLDYLGIPTGFTGAFSALPVRAYAKIWNEWYRDQDLQTALTIDTTSGVDTTTSTALQNIAWEKDYFTTSRPWTQKGPQISIPIVGNAPVSGLGITPTNTSDAASGATFKDAASGVSGTAYARAFALNTATMALRSSGSGATAIPDVFADLSTASAVEINELRLALALQRYEEARARYGSRYTEYLAYLGIRSSDARLQRPEYLGGGRQTIQFSEVLQTSPTTDGDDTEGVGNLKGHGVGAIRSNRFRRFFEEHGVVLSFMSVKPKTMYVQGLARMWNRRVKEDFWQKELQHIGQQELLNKELYAAHAQPDGTFGYQDRYDEYRHQESQVSGEFRSTLDMWHMARIFASAPTLNADFVKSNPTKRVLAVQNTDALWCMINHSIQARRLVSKTGTSFTF